MGLRPTQPDENAFGPETTFRGKVAEALCLPTSNPLG
jgi:hypothetical protein